MTRYTAASVLTEARKRVTAFNCPEDPEDYNLASYTTKLGT